VNAEKNKAFVIPKLFIDWITQLPGIDSWCFY